MRKKLKILFVVNRGAAELDWILPILYILSKRNLIYVIFNSEKVFSSVRKNLNLYSLLRKITNRFYTKKRNSYFVIKFIRKFLEPFKHILFISNIIEKINFRINNLEKFYIDNKKIKFDITLLEYGVNSGISKFIKFNTNSKIVYFPGTTYPLNLKKNLYLKKIKFIGDHILVNFNYKNFVLPKIFKKKNIYNLGNPKLENWWINKISKKNKKKKYMKSILFAYNSHFDVVNVTEKKKLENQLFNIMKVLISIKNLHIIFKIHPVKNDPYYLEILNKFPKTRWMISNEHLISLAKSCDVVLAPLESAAILEGISCNKPTIELWSPTTLVKESKNKFRFQNNIKTQNLEHFVFYINKALFSKQDKIWKKQKKNFEKFYNLSHNSSIKILKTFEKIEKYKNV